MNKTQKWTAGVIAAAATLGGAYQFIGGEDSDPTTIENNNGRVILLPKDFEGVHHAEDPLMFSGYEFDRYDHRRGMPIGRIKDKDGYATFNYMKGPDGWEVPEGEHHKFEVSTWPQTKTMRMNPNDPNDLRMRTVTVTPRLVGITTKRPGESNDDVRRRLWGDEMFEKYNMARGD